MELNSVSINLDTTKSVNFLPHRTSADGNCLFNPASLVATGDESLSTTLRILVCIELFLNAKFYAYHPYLEDAEGRSLSVIPIIHHSYTHYLSPRHQDLETMTDNRA